MPAGLIIAVLMLTAGALALPLYFRARGAGHPVDRLTLQPRAEAVAQARQAAGRICGPEVASWPAVTTTERDGEYAELRTLLEEPPAAADRIAARWGLRGEWRVRFLPPAGGTVLIGLNRTGDVVLADVSHTSSGAQHPMSAGSASAADVLGPAWRHAAPVTVSQSPPATNATPASPATAPPDGTPATARELWQLRDSAGGLQIDLDVRLRDGRVLSCDRSFSLASAGVDGHQRSLGRHDIAGGAAVLASVIAVTAGIIALIVADAAPLIGVSLAAAAVVFAFALAADALSFAATIAGSHRGDVSLRQYQVAAIIMSLSLALLYGLVVLVSFAAASALAPAALISGALTASWADAETLPAGLTTSDIAVLSATSIACGLAAAAIWLAASAAWYACLVRAGACRLVLNASRSFLAAGGRHRLLAGLTAGVAALTEETIYRYLAPVLLTAGLTLVLPGPAAFLLAALASTMLWALAHSSLVCRPASWRLAELVAAGFLLCLLTAAAGLLAAITAHIVFNWVTGCSHNDPPANPARAGRVTLRSRGERP